MPQTRVFNAGASNRGLVDVNGKTRIIPIGAWATLDLPAREIERIKTTRDETLKLKSKNLESPELTALTGLLSIIDTLPYEDALAKTTAALGVDPVNTRPTRYVMRNRIMARVRQIISPAHTAKERAAPPQTAPVAAEKEPKLEDIAEQVRFMMLPENEPKQKRRPKIRTR